MASEYFNYLARNEKPETPRPPMTRKEKILNWLSYNWYWFVIAAVILSVAGSMLWNVLGIGKVKPDYVFGYIGKEPISEEAAGQFEREIAALGSDVNEDGKVTVELRQFAVNRKGEAETALYYNYAADVLLLADITSGDSYFFLAEDPDGVQKAYQIFAGPDGTAPDENDHSTEGKVFAWAACPALSALNMDANTFSKLYLGRRYYAGDEAQKHAADSAFWDILTEGADQ